MILVGELEYTHRRMSPNGIEGFLFVGERENEYLYNISICKEDAWLGDNYINSKNLSITEFLQTIVDTDISIGINFEARTRAVIQFPDEVGIRLKGMKEWIKRQPLLTKKVTDK